MAPSRMKAWRRKRGLSRREAAARLNVALASVRNWEQGQRKIPPYIALLMQSLDKLRDLGAE